MPKLCPPSVAFILTMLLAAACSGPSVKTDPAQKLDNAPGHAVNKPPSSYRDTVLIRDSAAVFYNPDSLQLEKIRAVTEKGIFESNVHEYFFQMRNSRNVMAKYYPRLRIIEVKNARFLLFVKQGGEKELVDLDTKNDQSGIFLFDARKSPRFVDMTNIDTELGFYFSK
jgi:hypothetical protein